MSGTRVPADPSEVDLLLAEELAETHRAARETEVFETPVEAATMGPTDAATMRPDTELAERAEPVERAGEPGAKSAAGGAGEPGAKSAARGAGEPGADTAARSTGAASAPAPATAEGPAATTPPLTPLRRNRDFRLLWGGAGLSLLAGRATSVAYPLTALWTTGSAGAAGVVATALLLPQLLMQLPGGVLVDRWDRRRIMVFSGIAQALVAAAVTTLVLTGHAALYALAAAAFTEGCLGVLHQLAERAAVPAVVPAQQLNAALTGNEARTRSASIAGQPLGSGLLSLGASLPYLAASLAQLVSALCLFGVRGKLQQQRAAPPARLMTEVREGLSWMWHQPFLRAVMGAVAVSNLLFQGLTLCVMAGIQERGGSEFSVGLVLSLSGAGGLVGALTGGWWNARRSLRTLVVGGLIVWTALMIPVAALRDPVALGALFAASGYVGGVYNVAGGVYLVRVAPDHMRGRANSLVSLVGSGAMAAGPVAAGFLIEGFGPGPTVLVLSAVMGLTALAALLSPALRRDPLPAVPAGPNPSV